MKSQLLFLIRYINSKDNGQSMVEYVLIISLIAIALIVIVSNFGDALLTLYTNIRDELLGL